MTVEFDKSFDKDLEKIRDKYLLKKIKEVILNIEHSKTVLEVKNLKKMEGFQHFYRVRIGDYRLGIEILNNTATLIRFKHRKDIYKVFP